LADPHGRAEEREFDSLTRVLCGARFSVQRRTSARRNFTPDRDCRL
jgi:hypothetical protein